MAEPDREAIPDADNPLGIAGIEFIEYTTSAPQQLGRVVEMLGFQPVARHRSREVLLYRQGSMNLVINAHSDTGFERTANAQAAQISAVAFRVDNAGEALRRCVRLGAWELPSRAEAMELHIPGIRGPGSARFFFVDRWDDFSVFDVDFLPIPGTEQHPAAISDMRYFGVVQYVDAGRTAEWLAWYEQLFGFRAIPAEERFGILPHGTLMRAPDNHFLWQLVEPLPLFEIGHVSESLRRIGIGTPDIASAVSALESRGMRFVDSEKLHPDDRGALTEPQAGGIAFELVHDER